MTKQLKTIGTIVLSALITMNMAVGVFAEGNVNLSVDKNSCEVGEQVQVTLEATAPEDSAVPPQISIEYNPNRLSFDNCSVEYGGGGGGLITINDTSATIDFTTLSGGDAKVNVSAVLGEDAESIQSEVTISVNGEDTAVGTDNMSSTSTGVEAGTIDSGDGRIVQTVFADEFMPVLFHKATTDYQGQTIECAQFDMGDMTLIYTTDQMGSDGKFNIYNQMTGSMSDFRMIQGIENRFIIILDECEGAIPDGYTKAVLDWNGQTLTAYMNMDAASGNVSLFGGVNASDFFLVYGLSSEGTKGWYQYDQVEGTYQRFVMYEGAAANTSAELTEGIAAEDEKDASIFADIISGKVESILLIVFAVLVLVSIIVIVILAVKCAEYNDYEYVDPEDYYEHEAVREQDYSNKKTVTAAAVARKTFEEDEEVEGTNEASDEDNVDDNDEDITYEANEANYDVDDYFDPRLSKKELKAREKELRRQEKEAAKEEKWRLKEEKRAAKMRSKGYEEASPMDWGAFGEDMDNETDERRPMGRTKLPAYMNEETNEQPEDISEDINEEAKKEELRNTEEPQKMPARKINPALTARREEESVKAMKEDEQRKRQKRLFEQQQRIEEQRRIEQEQYEQEQKNRQAQFIASQQVDEDLDEDFQFEFLNL